MSLLLMTFSARVLPREQMRRVQVAVAVNIVRETPSHLTPRRYATNLLSVLARAQNVSRAAQTSAKASHAPARAACSEAPAPMAPSSLPAKTSATTASRDGNSSAAVVQAFCTTQHSGDVDESSRAAEKRTSEAQQSMRGAEHPSERHPLQTSLGAAYPVGMMRESRHPNKRVTTVSYQLHTETATKNIAAQCHRKVVAGSQCPTKTLTAVQCTEQTARGSGHRRGAVSAAQHIAEPRVLVQHSREMTTSTQTVLQTIRNTQRQRQVAGATRVPTWTRTAAQQPIQGTRASECLGEVSGAVQHLGFVQSPKALHQQRLLNRLGAVSPQEQPREGDKSSELLQPNRQENWTFSSNQSLAAEIEREIEHFKAGMPVDWLKCRDIAQILGDRVAAADRGLEETCLSVTTKFVAMLLRANREGSPLLYDRRRHHDRTANWWCVLGKVTDVVTPLCTAPPLMLRSGNILVETLINIVRTCARAGPEEDPSFELAYTVASILSRVVARGGAAVLGDAKDRPSPRASEEILQDVAAAGVPSLDAALAALESSLSQDPVHLFDDVNGSSLATPFVSPPLPPHSSSLSPEDAGARRFAMDARWHLLYWKSVIEDQCLALFSGSDGDALPMFILHLQEIVQTISRICQDTEEAVLMNHDME
ncbi:uncharacterized protein LOC125043308 isoform X2 [Penaeus chinensis]|uniref:uncharacterized protein LOC125043308 isoform X2 n=1 Tax=Penaeus chinensis TaxID=139456 RepID=UPI001FB59D48|nr:uncharacterized protein LOC125043308 isoform X2 [Penaeus chinensis]